MTLVRNRWAIPGILAVGLTLTLAPVVYVAAPRRLVNRLLALLRVLDAAAIVPMDAMRDGVVTADQRDALATLASQLGLTSMDALDLERAAARGVG